MDPAVYRLAEALDHLLGGAETGARLGEALDPLERRRLLRIKADPRVLAVFHLALVRRLDGDTPKKDQRNRSRENPSRTNEMLPMVSFLLRQAFEAPAKNRL